MKILQLRFKNLNSLAGEWKIDFTAPEYVSEGIFAISGPTGAGKSTIMDAICLALYGRTPRLKGISKNSNEIMSRHTGECFSEVVFETQKGQFRCTWRQHRARKKANEELQNPAHEIADAQSGTIIESKIKTVARAIEERTGMDFDRFTQSMLLAQGGFAAFLQADPNERAPILEQITGTEIYSKISVDVHERRRLESIKLDLLKEKTTGFVILNEEEENILILQLADIQNNESELIKKKTEIDHSVVWLNGMNKLKAEVIGIEKEAEVHSLALQNFGPERRMLEKALQAASLEGEYATITAKRKLQADELATLSKSELKMPDLETNLELAKKRHSEVSETLGLERKQADAELGKIKWVRALDITIKEKQTVLSKAILEHKGFLLDKISNIKKKIALQDELLLAKGVLSKVENYLITNKTDGVLVTELTGIKERLKNLQEVKLNYTTFGKQLAEAQKILEKAVQQHKIQVEIYQNLGEKMTGIRNKVAATKDALQNLLGERQIREYRADLNYLMKEMAFLSKIASLTTDRKQLEDNKPCPLCGALHHPYAISNIPEQDETGRKINELNALIDKSDKLETAFKIHEEEEKRVAQEVAEADKKLQQAHHYSETCQLVYDNNLTGQKLALENFSNLSGKITEILQPFGFTVNEMSNPESLSSELNSRLKNWEDNQQRKVTVEGEINGLISRIENINVLIRTLGSTLKTKSPEVSAYRRELYELENQRSVRYGLKDPDVEERRLQTLIFTAEKSEREASDHKNKVSQELDGLKNRIKELKTSTSVRKIELEIDELTFLASLQSAGFDDETIFTGCSLSRERREELGRQATSLDLKQADIITRKRDRERQLVTESAKKLTEIPLVELTEQQQTAGNSLLFIRENIGAIRQKLADNIIARKNLGETMLLIEAQKTELKRWDLLYNLIGSADGKKYRNFAQGLTFEIMVAHANVQLMKLTDRYLLTRDKDQPLDLNVIDNYQAGEVRSTKNLSGGESFIVSLALALGLSKMASKKVRVDSLFLDEGFGSLDEDTLETALETLANLRQDGKLIGVISHVSALKERITTKILVHKSSGGKSTITGPGCSQGN